MTNFGFTWERERQSDKFYHPCLNSGVVPSLYLQPKIHHFSDIVVDVAVVGP